MIYHISMLVNFCLLILCEKKETWCVAKPSTDNAVLNENIQYACSIVDCRELQPPNGKCFFPNNILFHASAAMNIYYQVNGRKTWTCYFNNTGLITVTDPSMLCHFNLLIVFTLSMKS